MVSATLIHAHSSVGNCRSTNCINPRFEHWGWGGPLQLGCNGACMMMTTVQSDAVCDGLFNWQVTRCLIALSVIFCGMCCDTAVLKMRYTVRQWLILQGTFCLCKCTCCYIDLMCCNTSSRFQDFCLGASTLLHIIDCDLLIFWAIFFRYSVNILKCSYWHNDHTPRFQTSQNLQVLFHLY